jgi:hypothetical protein
VSIAATLAGIVADTNAAAAGAASEARVIALLDALADLLGRLCRDNGGTKTATGLCTIILIRAQEKRG